MSDLRPRTPQDQHPRRAHSVIRAEAEKWARLAAEDGGATDPKAEEMLSLLDEIDLLREAVEWCEANHE